MDIFLPFIYEKEKTTKKEPLEPLFIELYLPLKEEKEEEPPPNIIIIEL